MCTRRACASSSSWGALYAARYAHICSPHTATSRVRERRTATHSATGAANATVCVASGGALIRLRISGAATPAATTPQAVALISLDSRTGPEYMAGGGGPQLAGTRAEAAPTNVAMTPLAVSA